MASHKLSLDIPATANTHILRIVDMSVYTELLPVTCPELLITVPGFQYSASIAQEDLGPGFDLKLTACDLELQRHNCESRFEDIPDGIYAIKYSVSPNEYVYVAYNHLRITKALLELEQILCDMDLSNCDLGKEKSEKLQKVMMIKGYLEAAKAEVELCHEAKKGMELYNYALKLMKKLNCKNC